MLNNFIYAQTKELFLEQLNAGNILDEAIVFIEDSKEIWNRGHYFGGSDVDPELFSGINAAIDALNSNKLDISTAESTYAKIADIPSAVTDSTISGWGYIKATAADTAYAPASLVTTVNDQADTIATLATKTELGDVNTDLQTFKSNVATTYATDTDVANAVAALVDSSPETLNTLAELAAALGDDPNFATTVATSIGQKADQTALDQTNASISDIATIRSNAANGNNAWASYGTATSVVSVPIDYKIIKCTISAAASFTLASVPPAGREIHVLVYNSGSADVVVSLPVASPYVNFSGDSLTIPAGGYAEINVISDGSIMFIRHAA